MFNPDVFLLAAFLILIVGAILNSLGLHWVNGFRITDEQESIDYSAQGE
jgi:hypothetical protein